MKKYNKIAFHFFLICFLLIPTFNKASDKSTPSKCIEIVDKLIKPKLKKYNFDLNTLLKLEILSYRSLCSLPETVLKKNESKISKNFDKLISQLELEIRQKSRLPSDKYVKPSYPSKFEMKDSKIRTFQKEAVNYPNVNENINNRFEDICRKYSIWPFC